MQCPDSHQERNPYGGFESSDLVRHDACGGTRARPRRTSKGFHSVFCIFEVHLDDSADPVFDACINGGFFYNYAINK